MRSFLINKNLCFYHWLRKKIGRSRVFVVARAIEKTILIFGREVVLYRLLYGGEESDIKGLLNTVLGSHIGHSFCYIRTHEVIAMKRSLILFIMIVFSVVNCAGPNKVGWTKPGFPFHQDEFEKDRKKCIQTLDNSLDSQGFGKALEECLAKKGYKYEAPPEPPSDNEKAKTLETAKTVGKVLLVTDLVAVIVAALAASVVLSALTGH
jgi:hypothetical protein